MTKPTIVIYRTTTEALLKALQQASGEDDLKQKPKAIPNRKPWNS